MATATGLSGPQIIALIQQAFINHRNSLLTLQNLYAWSSGLTAAEMASATGLSVTDAGTYQAAIADGNAESLTHFTGFPPVSYPQPASGYVYNASQSRVIGPQ